MDALVVPGLPDECTVPFFKIVYGRARELKINVVVTGKIPFRSALVPVDFMYELTAGWQITHECDLPVSRFGASRRRGPCHPEFRCQFPDEVPVIKPESGHVVVGILDGKFMHLASVFQSLR